MKKIFVLVILSLFVLTGCDNEPEVQSGVDSNIERPIEERPMNQERPPATVTDTDLDSVPDGLYAVPIAELSTHALSDLFLGDQWGLCHLTSDCTENIFRGIRLAGDVLHFETPLVRERTFLVSGYRNATCWANDTNSLLICDGFTAGDTVVGTTMASHHDDLMEEKSVVINELTVFEHGINDGWQINTTPTTRSDFEHLLAGNQSGSLFVDHELVGDELVATRIFIMTLAN